MALQITDDHFARSEDYVRNFFAYTDPDNDAVVEIFRIAVYRTAAALAMDWEFPDEDVRLARNLEFLRDTLPSETVDPKSLVDSEVQLVSFPDIYFRIREVLDNASSSAEDIAKVVSTDVELTTKLLKLVNSPFYALVQKVEDVAHAISLVGQAEVANLAIGISATKAFKDIPTELIDMEAFWKHSVSCGVFAKLIASRIEGLKPDRFFTAGLLHDVGRLIMFKKLPYSSIDFLLYARENTVPVLEGENEVLGFNHAQLAEILLTEWKLPPALVDDIAHHHDPSQAKDKQGAAILQLADNLANAMEISSGSLFVLPGLEEGAWDHIPIKVEELIDIVGLFDEHIEDLFKSFL